MTQDEDLQPNPPGPAREAMVFRESLETKITLKLFLDGGPVRLSTPNDFFSHMLNTLARYAGWGLELEIAAVTDPDLHHSVEDCGLVLGGALATALGDFTGHRRYASALVPMDDALAEAALDAGRRPYLHFEANFPQSSAGGFDFCLVEEFFRALTTRAGWTLHLTGRRGRNSHHLAEALFKAAGLAAKEALAPRGGEPLTTKGVF
jgi:imidazoleglycerol-phosphate dehydratase